MKKLNKIIEYGLYLLVFLLPWQTRLFLRGGEINGGYSEYLTISLYATDILLLILLVIFFIYKFLNNSASSEILPGLPRRTGARNDSFRKIWWLIAGLELMVFVSIFFAPDKGLAVYAYARFLLGIGLFWLVLDAAYDRTKFLFWLLAGICLQAVLGIWQFLTQSDFAWKWLGMAFHSPGDLGTSVVETISGERWLRAYGGLDHPNMLGGLLAIAILIVIGIVLKNNQSVKYKQNANKIQNANKTQDTRHKIQTRYKTQDTNKIQDTRYKTQDTNNDGFLNFGYWNLKFVYFFFLVSCVFVLLVGLFFTFSRGAWAGLIIGAAVMLGLAVFKKDFLVQKKILKIILSGSVLIFILFNIYGDLAQTRLSNNARLELKSNREREASLSESWGVIKNNWLFGTGIGNYTNYLAARDSRLGVKNQAWSYQPAHNVFLLVWAEVGIFGLLFFVLILIYSFWHLIKNSNKNIYKTGLLTAIAAMFMVDHWWWSLHFGVLFFWLLLGIIMSDDKQQFGF